MCWPGVFAVRMFVKSSMRAGGAAELTRKLNWRQARYIGDVGGTRFDNAGTAEILESQSINIQGSCKRREKTEHSMERFQTGNQEKTTAYPK